MADRRTNLTVRKLQIAQGQAVSLGIFIMKDIVTQVGAAILKDATGATNEFTKLAAASVTRNRERYLKKIHTEAAEDALVSVVEAYRSGKKKGTTPYRQGDRYSGGKLERALSSPNMYRAARDGLDFINRQWLDAQAAQWYRMNFGVGPRGSQTKRRPGDARVRVFGQATPIDFALRGYKPGPAMSLPVGFWLTQGGRVTAWDANRRRFSDHFYPTGSTPEFETLGFAGSRFLDAGVERLAKTLPLQYEKMLSRYFTEYQQTGGGPVSTQKIKLSNSQVDRAARKIRADIKRLERELGPLRRPNR